MRLATIGTSAICEHFLKAAGTVPGIDLYAVYSRDAARAEAFRAAHGAEKAFTSLEAMAADPAVDAVYIASPNALHAAQSRLFLEHGRHVLCEKPAATTCRAFDALSSLAKERGLIYAEAIMSIHTPAFRLLQAELKTLGAIRSVSLQFCQLSSRYPAFLRGENPNIFNPRFEAGCLMDIGVYNLYLAAALFGEPTAILSDAVFLENGADAAGNALLKYDGLTAALTYSKTAQGYAPSEIFGDKGTIQIASISQLTGIERVTPTGRKTLVPFDVSRTEVMAAEAAFFRDCVQNGEHPFLPFARETARTVRRMCDEIRRQNRFPF